MTRNSHAPRHRAAGLQPDEIKRIGDTVMGSLSFNGATTGANGRQKISLASRVRISGTEATTASQRSGRGRLTKASAAAMN